LRVPILRQGDQAVGPCDLRGAARGVWSSTRGGVEEWTTHRPFRRRRPDDGRRHRRPARLVDLPPARLSSPRKTCHSTPRPDKNDGMTLSIGKLVYWIARLWPLAHRRTSAGSGLLGLSARTGATEVEEVEALLAAVDTDRRDFALRLSSRLGPARATGCAAPRYRGASVPRAAQLRFADATTLLVRVAVPGELGTLAVPMRRGSLKPAAFTTAVRALTRRPPRRQALFP
jgi:hypothetical protein